MTLKKHAVPEKKIKAVKELVDLFKNNKTILIASIKDLPASEFQEIGKKLRGKAIIKFPKKNLFNKAIEILKDKDIERLKEHFRENMTILFSNLDGYELATELIKRKSPARAKAGQIAPTDITIEAGPTDLPPGPAISELGAVGLKVQIEKGKIMIKESKVIVKEGEKISQPAVDIMNKLDIKPFFIGFVPLTSYDNESKKLYLEIKIDSEEVIRELKEGYNKALAFVVEIGYVCKDSISFLLGKAGRYEKSLSNLIKPNTPEIKSEEVLKKEASEESSEGEK